MYMPVQASIRRNVCINYVYRADDSMSVISAGNSDCDVVSAVQHEVLAVRLSVFLQDISSTRGMILYTNSA